MLLYLNYAHKSYKICLKHFKPCAANMPKTPYFVLRTHTCLYNIYFKKRFSEAKFSLIFHLLEIEKLRKRLF